MQNIDEKSTENLKLQKLLPHPIASDTLKIIPDKVKRTKANQVSESETFFLFSLIMLLLQKFHLLTLLMCFGTMD